MRVIKLDDGQVIEYCLAGTAQFDDKTNTISYATFNILTGDVEVRQEIIESKTEYFKRKLEGE